MPYIPPPEPESDATRHWRSTSTGEWVQHPKGTRPQFPPGASVSADLVPHVPDEVDPDAGRRRDAQGGRR
jgi:hypothetical protein